jgi:hypothetical protein
MSSFEKVDHTRGHERTRPLSCGLPETGNPGSTLGLGRPNSVPFVFPKSISFPTTNNY